MKYKSWLQWIRALDELIFPPNPVCPLCKERPVDFYGACQLCLESLVPAWRRDTIHGYPYYSLFSYKTYVRDLLREMKFSGGFEIAQTFGLLLGAALREEPELARAKWLIPVPLHSTRLAKRGFNQAAILADTISKGWKPVVSQRLVRIRATAPQSGLSLAERKRNLQGAFRVLPGESFQEQKCLIVDDVITSGYTFSILAQLIEEQGGSPYGVFVARTELKEDENA